MNRKKIIFLIITPFLLYHNFLYSLTKKSNVLILNFENIGEANIDYYDDLIQNSLFAFFKMIPDYSAIHPNTLKEYMEKNNYKKGDLENQKTLFKISKDFNADNIIRGTYYEKEGYLIIDFEVIDTNEKKIIYRSSKFGKGGINIFETLDEIVISMVEDFIGIKLEFATLEINTDQKCKLFIDYELYGETPIKTKLLTGKHNINITYNDEKTEGSILKKEINLTKDQVLNIDINVFVNLKIDAERECNVLLNNKKVGITPYEDKILSGNIYKLKVIYFDEEEKKEMTVNESDLSTIDRKDINLFYPMYCKLNLESGTNPFFGSISENNIEKLPFSYSNLFFGEYRIKIFLDDKKWNKKYYFYNKKINLKPLEEKTINLSNLDYKRKFGFCFIPAAAQFYNREYVKASLLLSFFMTTITITALSPLFSYIYYQYDYLPKVDEWEKNGSDGKYTEDDIRTSYYNSGYIFQGFLIGGLISSAIIWIFSVIDGIINMNHIYYLINPDKKPKRNKLPVAIKPVINIKVGMNNVK